MPANIGETDVLNYLVKTGPISLADLVLRFDDPPKMLRTLDSLREREEVDIDQADVIKRIINHIDQVPAHQMVEASYNVLRDTPEAKSIVRLTDRGFKKAVV
ncbi:MAG TPA: hypothetical protein VKL99_08515 [Candidatus Angelobacter sp.]|nr:hypothetical protein [Candidatus Angelobacter sp.]